MNCTSSRLLWRHAAVACAAAGALLLGGCESMSERERGGARGAGIGAAAGAVLGSVTGSSAGRGAVIGAAVGAVAGNLWSKRLEDKQRAIEQRTQGTGIAVDRTSDDRLRVNVPSDVSFDSGRAEIKPQMRSVLDEVGRNLEPGMRVTVVGHTDSTGDTAANETLARQRAQAVSDYLAMRGAGANRITARGRGAREPVASNDTDAGRAANRRVEIYLSDSAA